MIKVVSNYPNYLRYCTCEKCASVIEFQRKDCIESKRFGDNGWLELYWYNIAKLTWDESVFIEMCKKVAKLND